MMFLRLRPVRTLAHPELKNMFLQATPGSSLYGHSLLALTRCSTYAKPNDVFRPRFNHFIFHKSLLQISCRIHHSSSTLTSLVRPKRKIKRKNLSPEVSNPLDKSSKTVLEATEPLTQVCQVPRISVWYLPYQTNGCR